MSSSTAAAPTCLIISSSQSLQAEIEAILAARGIISLTKETLSELANPAMAIWIGSDVNLDQTTLSTILDQYKHSLGKLLLCVIHDAPLSTSAEIELRLKENQTAVNNLLAVAQSLQIDARATSLLGLITPNNDSGSLFDTLLVQRQQPPRTTQLLTPLTAASAAKAIIEIWFERQHRGKWVALSGEPVSRDDIIAALTQLQNPATNLEWDDGSTFSPDHRRHIHEPNLKNLFPAQKETTLPEKRLIMSPPSQSENEAPFKAVVITPPSEERVPSQTISPPPQGSPQLKPASAVIPKKIPRPHKEVIKPRALIPQNIVSWGKRGVVVTISVSCLLLLIAIVPTLLPIARAYRLTSSSTVSEMTAVRQALSSSPTWPTWMLAVPGIKQGLLAMSKSHHQALTHVLTVATASHLDNAITSSLTASSADPYVSLLETRLSLDQAYQWASKTQTSPEDLNLLSQARSLTGLLPQLFPPNTRVDVLVLLQNNLELRPTGGFIGSVALITVDNGKMINLETRDIYELDASLRGVVTPPQEVAQYLGESNWYFRDANWNPSFSQSASTANWFLEKEWGRRANIVVGVNLNSIKSLLSIVGPITVATGETINAENLLISALNHQDVASAKPEDQKQEFLSLLVRPMIDALVAADASTKYQALLAIGQSLQAQETTLMVQGPLQAVLHNLGWAGEIIEPECPNDAGSPCQTDSILVNETNVGINKANYYLSRNTTHTATLEVGTIAHQHQILYQNQSPADIWPAGPYKTYTRIYLPKAAQNPTVRLNDAPIATTALSLSATSTHQVIGLYYEISPQQTTTLDIQYTTPRRPDIRAYQLHFFKQPGQLAGPLTINLNAATPVSANGHLSNQHQQAFTHAAPVSFSVKVQP